MKFILFVSAFILSAISAHAEDHNYKCISQTLQAFNSDIYYNLSNAEIDQLLSGSGGNGIDSEAMKIANLCDKNLNNKNK